MTDKKSVVRQPELRQYLDLGYQLIPLHKWDAVDGKKKPRGKSPMDSNWAARAYVNDEVVEMAANRGLNVGVRLRRTDLIIDIDPRNFPAGRDVKAELVKAFALDLDSMPHVVTGSGGDHYYCTKPADASVLDSLKDFPGIEFKSHGRQVVAAGSKHPCGKYYAWDDFAPPLAEVKPLPANLLEAIKRPMLAHGNNAEAGEIDPERLAEALDHLKPEDFRSHQDWLDLMMACHHATAGEGRQEFINWSTTDPQYANEGSNIGRRWDSLSTETSDRPITIKYLHKKVQETGNFIRGDAPEDDFDEVDDVDQGETVDDAKLRDPGEVKRTVLEEMNEKHCVVDDGGKCRVFTEKWDPVLKRFFYSRSTKQDFEALYASPLIEVGDKCLPRGTWWFNQSGKRQYEGILFDPEQDHEGWLNLWRGWAYDPAPGDWSMLKQLLLEVLCDGEQEHYEYVMNWAAYMIQHPGRQAEVALVFKGEKGTGKGTFGRALTYLAGPQGMHISSPEHLTGRFNSHLKNCIALFADEAFWAGNKAGESVLKQLVTEPMIVYEGKGQNAEAGKNLIHIIIASNSDWVVPAGLDGERRFAVFDVNRNRQGDKAFFKALHHQMDNGGYKAMLHELMNRDLGDWAPRDNVPQTTALTEQKLASMDMLEAWWYEKLQDGFIQNMRGVWENEGPFGEEILILKEYLRNDYFEYCRNIGGRMKLTEVTFSKQLGGLVPGLRPGQAQAAESDFGVKAGRDGRVPVYRFPSLRLCREAFEKKLGCKIKW